jgi:hypothetical protein
MQLIDHWTFSAESIMTLPFLFELFAMSMGQVKHNPADHRQQKRHETKVPHFQKR